MKLFIDDVRSCPKGWVLARTVTEAIRYLDTQDVTHISLDHDIGCRLVTGQEHSSNETFEPVARFLAVVSREVYACTGDKIDIRIHTSNFDAGRKMAKILNIQDQYIPYIYDPKDY